MSGEIGQGRSGILMRAIGRYAEGARAFAYVIKLCAIPLSAFGLDSGFVALTLGSRV